MENDVRVGLESFRKAGIALEAICSRSLYREQYDTFDRYCRENWNFGSHRAWQLIEASKQVRKLEEHFVFTKTPMPANECQMRTLARVNEALRPAIWRTSVNLSKGQSPRTALISELVDRARAGIDPARLVESIKAEEEAIIKNGRHQAIARATKSDGDRLLNGMYKLKQARKKIAHVQEAQAIVAIIDEAISEATTIYKDKFQPTKKAPCNLAR